MTAKGFDVGGRYSSDPIGSAGKSSSQRKASRDPGLTPTEKRQKGQLMNQFRRSGEGPGGNSDAYRASAAWCRCGRGLNGEHGCCSKCIDDEDALTCSRCGGGIGTHSDDCWALLRADGRMGVEFVRKPS